MPDPISSIALGPEFQVPSVQSDATESTGAPGFGGMLESSIDKLNGMLQDASNQSTALAAGTTDDLTGAVVSVERAQLGLQLAVQVRNKVVDAYQEIFRMQV